MPDKDETTVLEFANQMRNRLDEYVAKQEHNSYMDPETYPTHLREDEWFEAFQDYVFNVEE